MARKPTKQLTSKAGAVREVTTADMKKMQPIKKAAPDVLALMQKEKSKRQRGRPKAATTRELLTVRVDPQLSAMIKAYGSGYGAKVEAVLLQAALNGAFGRSGGARK